MNMTKGPEEGITGLLSSGTIKLKIRFLMKKEKKGRKVMKNVFKNRIMIAALAVLTMMVMFAGCGSSSAPSADEPEAPAGPVAVESQTGMISVEAPDESLGLVTFVSDYYEEIQFNVADEAEPAHRTDNTKFIDIATGDKSGIPGNLYLSSFTNGSPYTADMMKADLEAQHEAYPNILEEEADVTIGDIAYFRWSVTTNGSPAYYYFACVNEKPVAVQVVGEDLIDSPEVQAMLESIKWNV